MRQRLSIGRSVAILVCLSVNAASAAHPKNVILMIGDGMGFEQVRAAGMYLHGQEGTLSFEDLPYQGQVTTYSANNSVTDSAAAGTAIATGHKVNNDVVSVAIPGDGHELQTLLEYYKLLDYRTALVTTTYLTHATPATFGAHETHRDNKSQIAADYLNQTRPNLLFGGGENGITTTATSNAGYSVVTNCAGLQAINPDTATMVSAQFGNYHLPYEYDGYSSQCHLSQLTTWALDMLEEDPDGFFLMVEGGRIDHAGHDHDLPRNIFETIEFDATVQIVLDWAQANGWSDTLVIVTADHETGGLIVDQNNGKGVLPTVRWTVNGHSGVNVPIYAQGVNAELIGGVMDNTDLFDIVTRSPDLYVSPLSFTHEIDPGASLGNDTFIVQNTGSETLTYSITDNAGWLSVDPTGGTSSGEPDTINIIYNTASLPVAVHQATITVSAPEANNSPQEIAVTVTVKPIPGDFDNDLDVDQSDFGHIQACLSGEGIAQSNPDCQNANLDNDTDVDQIDILKFRGCMSGPNHPADPHCAD